jgi:hypothetical protein
MKNLKQFLLEDTITTKVSQGWANMVRVDGRRRHFKDDAKDNFFSMWYTQEYVERSYNESGRALNINAIIR